MQAEAEPKPRRRRNEAAGGAPVARWGAWVGLCHGQEVEAARCYCVPRQEDESACMASLRLTPSKAGEAATLYLVDPGSFLLY